MAKNKPHPFWRGKPTKSKEPVGKAKIPKGKAYCVKVGEK